MPQQRRRAHWRTALATLGSALASISACTISVRPSSTARCSAVHPDRCLIPSYQEPESCLSLCACARAQHAPSRQPPPALASPCPSRPQRRAPASLSPSPRSIRAPLPPPAAPPAHAAALAAAPSSLLLPVPSANARTGLRGRTVFVRSVLAPALSSAVTMSGLLSSTARCSGVSLPCKSADPAHIMLIAHRGRCFSRGGCCPARRGGQSTRVTPRRGRPGAFSPRVAPSTASSSTRAHAASRRLRHTRLHQSCTQ